LRKRFYEQLLEPDSFNSEKNIDGKTDGKGMKKIRWEFYYFPGINIKNYRKGIKLSLHNSTGHIACLNHTFLRIEDLEPES